MAFREISIEDFSCAAVRLLSKDRLLLTAEDGEGRINAMTVGWGGIGVFWGKPVVIYGIRPERYTYSFAESGTRVTLSAFPRELAAALTYCGTHSGREGDKIRAAGLTPCRMPDGGHGYTEASLVITAEKCYSHAMRPEEILDAEASAFYRQGGYHTLYMARIRHIFCAE